MTAQIHALRPTAFAIDVHETVVVDEFTDGVLDPAAPMLGPVKDGGEILATTAPGCWGPMITPAIRGGHEVTRPVQVAGAEVGDAVAIHIEDVRILSWATASGTDRTIANRFRGDPFVDDSDRHATDRRRRRVDA